MGNGWKTTYVFQSCDVWNVAQHSRHSAAIFQKCFRNGDCFMLFHVVSVVPKFEDRPKGHAPRVSPKHCLLAPGTPNASSGSCKAGGVEGNLCAVIGWAWDMEYSKYSMSCMWVVLHKITQDPSQFLSAIQECVCIYMYTLYIYIYIFPVLNSYILCARYTYIYIYIQYTCCMWILPVSTSIYQPCPMNSPDISITGRSHGLKRWSQETQLQQLREEAKVPYGRWFCSWRSLKLIEGYWTILRCHVQMPNNYSATSWRFELF